MKHLEIMKHTLPNSVRDTTKKVTETTKQRDARQAKTAIAKAAAKLNHKTTTAADRPHETAVGLSHKTTATAGSYENAAEQSPAEST
ncbi:12791_t:CDS:2 [Funneliformis mosseae]|uniref:12791_t:CDS:1 n=1 Tax=Funneliformis mosseae TaxID=27381 RepID=A0A9N9H9X8_FUNMO|nr:12791_t:CDS:2 [Funneliformis mosseae]